MSQIRSAATPNRRRISGAFNNGNPQTPDDIGGRRLSVSGNAVTPMKRMPILANFEEWMKMATDNKINATNSWNFALIDYFHDMSLLKEGDGVNFQRASCTLDGCVKIYTSRVDSVATETGRLLSGLAENKEKKKRGEGDEEEGAADGDEDEEEDGEDGVKKKTRKRAARAEATLATSFAQLQLKKMELEFAVDPLFKKASADFDEGGAKGLLLNHLCIDGKGRIVFDSSDDTGDGAEKDVSKLEDATSQEDEQPVELDISALGAKFFPELSKLDDQDICPSLKDLDLGDNNGALDLPFLKAPDNWREQLPSPQKKDADTLLDDLNERGFDDDDGDIGGFDLPPETGFGEGGEAWAREAALEPQTRVFNVGHNEGDGEMEDGVGGVGDFEIDSKQYGVSLSQRREDDHENILNYFDQALSKNWAGPEHWKIRKVKDNAKAAAAGPTKRKEKEPFEIDFAAPMNQALADMLYTSATSNSSISLPKTQWKSKTRNLLPDDKHFNSKQLLRLFLKPKARMGSRKPGCMSYPAESRRETEPEGEADEAYWARKEDPVEGAGGEEGAQGNYDANFFQDDNLGIPGGGMDDDDDFADAREAFSPPAEGAEGDLPPTLDGVLGGSQEGAFGTQLVAQNRRLRPEYVQYARVAKKVDVRRLKEELWRGIGFEEVSLAPPIWRPSGVLRIFVNQMHVAPVRTKQRRKVRAFHPD